MVKVTLGGGGVPLMYKGQINYGWGIVFTQKNNFINFSPGFVNLKPGFHLWGVLCRRDYRLDRGLI